MVMNDPIADMLTRIRNAQVAKHDTVVLPASNAKKAIAKILLAEGYVKNVDFHQRRAAGEQSRSPLSTSAANSPLSRASRRFQARPARYTPRAGTAQGAGRPGIAIISTSKGLMTDRDARKQMIGGEVLAYIW
jgi:small subunit ribosomal protein S8